MHLGFKVEGGDFSRAGNASSQVKKVLKELGVDPGVIKKVVVALYEAEVNIAAHAWWGTIDVEVESEGIEMVLQDEGPGIPDIPRAMEPGFSTASSDVRAMGFGAGMGLPNIRDNADEFEITSTVGVGTRLRIKVNF
jgi:anti-sigma regulatory factor (Ser/Thr protein kinase)